VGEKGAYVETSQDVESRGRTVVPALPLARGDGRRSGRRRHASLQRVASRRRRAQNLTMVLSLGAVVGLFALCYALLTG